MPLVKKKMCLFLTIFVLLSSTGYLIYRKTNEVTIIHDWYDKKMNITNYLSNESSDQCIAILDSGYRENIGIINSENIFDKYNFIDDNLDVYDDNGHGSTLLSLLSGFEYGRDKYIGVSPYSKKMILKVVDKYGKAKSSDVAEAIIYAANKGATLINISLGVYTNNIELEESVKYAISKGIKIIAAVGDSQKPFIAYPARYDGVISVEAQSPSGNRYKGSNISNYTKIRFPGVNITCLALDEYDNEFKPNKKTGSSLSSVLVSGIYASILDNGKEINLEYAASCMNNNKFINLFNFEQEKRRNGNEKIKEYFI